MGPFALPPQREFFRMIFYGAFWRMYHHKSYRIVHCQATLRTSDSSGKTMSSGESSNSNPMRI